MASLKKFTDDLLNDINQFIIATNEEQEDTLKIAEAVVIKALLSIKKLKEFVDNYKFKTSKEEIEFFKFIKPQIFSKLIYYTKVLNIETKRPKGTDRTQRKYLLNELNNLNRFFDNNLEFYQYYRTGST